MRKAVPNLLLLILLLSFSYLVSTDYLPDYLALHVEASRREASEGRNSTLSNVLSKASGVYASESKASSFYAKTVVILVVVQNHSHQYEKMLLNWLCFAEHFDIKLIVYTTSMDLKQLIEGRFHRERVHLMSYPEALFWLVVSKKKSHKLNTGNRHVNYNSTVPSIKHFGTMVKLVPILEVIKNGYHAIYFDVDALPLVDPIPFLQPNPMWAGTKSTVTIDFVTSIEMKYCPDEAISFPSHPQSRSTFSWEDSLSNHPKRLEPNSGVLSVGASESAIRFMENWFDDIVRANFLNDQHAFRLFNDAEFISDCNWVSNTSRTDEVSGNVSLHTRPRVCLLNEMLFQNGKIGSTGCFNEPAYRENMISMGLNLNPNPKPNPNLELNLLEGNASSRIIHVPVMFHANMGGTKTLELMRRGLWLLNDDDEEVSDMANDKRNYSCKVFKVEDTMWGRHQWNLSVGESHSR